MIQSKTSSLKSPSGSSSSSTSSGTFSCTIGGVKSGSEVCGRRFSEGCRNGISVYFYQLYSEMARGENVRLMYMYP